MKHPFILVLLVAMLLCGCGGKSKAPDEPSSSPRTDASVDRHPAGDAPSQPDPQLDLQERDLGDYVSFPACGIKIRRPEGFEKQDSFDGFGQSETQSSIMAVSILGPYSKITAGFTQEQMKGRRWTWRSRHDVKVDGVPGILVHFEQPAYGQVFLKWSLAFGNEQKTTLVTASFPKSHDRELSARLKAAVLSTRLDRSPPPDPENEIPFAIACSAKLRLTPVMSKTLAYTKDGVIPAKSPQDPLFIAAPALAKAPAGDKRQFAERRLRQTAHTKGLTVKSTDAITIDGLDGYESLAGAEDAKSGTPLIVYQMILFDEESYVLMQGLVGTELRDEYLPEFKAMARSFQRRQP